MTLKKQPYLNVTITSFCRLWASHDEVFCKAVFLKLSKILSNFLRYSNKIEATGVENTPIRKNIWCKTLWMDVWNNWVTIPKDGQSKKIQCIQDSKHIEKDITRSAVFSSWLRITSFYWRVILSGPDIQTLKSELKKLYRESWIL